MDNTVLVPLSLFAMIAAIVIAPRYFRSRDRQRLHETLRLAYEKGQPVPPELIEALQPSTRDPVTRAEVLQQAQPRARAERDLRSGVIWLAVGLGLVGVGAAFYAGLYNDGGAAETFGTFAALGAIPACIGLAYLGLWRFNRRRDVG